MTHVLIRPTVTRLCVSMLIVALTSTITPDAAASHPSKRSKQHAQKKTGTTLSSKALKSGIPSWRRPSLHRADVTTRLRHPNPHPYGQMRAKTTARPRTYPQHRKYLSPHASRPNPSKPGGFRYTAKRFARQVPSGGKKWLSQASSKMRTSVTKARQHVNQLCTKLRKQIADRQRHQKVGKKLANRTIDAARKRKQNQRAPTFNRGEDRKAYEAAMKVSDHKFESATRKNAQQRVKSLLSAVRNGHQSRKGTSQ